MTTITSTMTKMDGATVRGGKTEFRVWAPTATQIKIQIVGRGEHAMRREGEHFVLEADAGAGNRYSYIVDGGKPVPDPVSRLLPEGVHGPTEIIDPDAFQWSDQSWRGIQLSEYIIYELHVGTFTPEGTFDSAIGKLDYLKQLGVSAIEVMPVSAFPGTRNWGYDGVSPYAVQESYGGPEAMKRFVDAAHARGLAVVLDVVYNHLGNEGNYLRMFGPYFTDKHKTPWGEAVNYDQPGSGGVRRYVIENALYWVREYHIDGLRLDAVQTIKDDSNPHILKELQQNVQQLAHELGRTVTVVAETDENDEIVTRPVEHGGYGLDGVWSDDFHHSVHALLTKENQGYYQDFGRLEQVVRALNEGFVFQGEHFNFWRGPRGTSSKNMPTPAHVICTQNHDQVGNRAQGERLTQLVPRGARKLSAALLLLAPHTPLLFMGQEYDEPAPFQFFTSYGDPSLKEAVRKGRREEFKDFAWDEVPDPEDPRTFERSKLHWELAVEQNEMLRWYRELIELRKRYVSSGSVSSGSKDLGTRMCGAELTGSVITLRVPAEQPRIECIASFDGPLTTSTAEGWREVMRTDEDGYAVSVRLREM